VIVEILRTIQEKGVLIYNKDEYSNLRRIDRLIKLYIGFSKSGLENALSSNIVKPGKPIGQKQVSNLLENTE